MRLARTLERTLEALLDGVAGRLFRGPLHPAELAGRIIRAMEFEDRAEIAANLLVIGLNPREFDGVAAHDGLATGLAEAVEDAAWERGWRLEGPAEVRIEADPQVRVGGVRISGEVQRGPRPVWARLRGDRTVHELTHNRSVIGRHSDADVRITVEQVSRRHALIRRSGGRVLLEDLGSSNGTRLDGVDVRGPVTVTDGSVIAFGPVSVRFEER